MKMNAKLFFSALMLMMLLLLMACTTTVEKKIYVVAYPPDELIVSCQIEEPPFGTEEYLTLSDEEREKKTFKYISSLITTNILCNERIDGIRNWKTIRQKEKPQEP